ncbi:hypothetical protein HQ529_04385 [Candidatus Woesearchaeota archaeon]|nr:hypothetical protein [Candidatus Woesearchaeota archaeon]
MTDFNVAFDMDDVLVPFYEYMALRFMNKYKGTNLVWEDLTDYKLSVVCDIAREEGSQIVLDFYKSNEFLSMPPIEGSIESVENIEADKKTIITSRPELIKRFTDHFILGNYTDIDHPIIYSDHWTDQASINKNKGEICNELEIQLMFEDRIKHALDCARKEVLVIMPEYPWNSQRQLLKRERNPEVLERIHRVQGLWPEMEQKYNDIREKL